MTKFIYPSTLLCDFYKVSHRVQYPENTQVIYSTFTPRSNKYFPVADEVVFFGLQAFLKKYLIEHFNTYFFRRSKQDVLDEYERYIHYTLGEENPDTTHIKELWELGYLPLEIRALKEGTLAPIKVPVLTVENTDDRFFWVTNYIETILSTQIWQPMTSATIAYQYKKLLDEYALKTVGNTEGVQFQGHDFSMRGMSSLESAQLSGAGHLLSFTGTDTIPAIMFHEEFYKANIENELVGTSIPATEHSVMCAYGNTNEFDLFKRLITQIYPNGLFSVVSDTWDFWKVVGEYLPKLKDEIMERDGRVVIRPDSGDPVDILCGKHFEDLTNDKWCETLESAKETFYEMMMEDLRDRTPHGEYGESRITDRFKYDGKYYEMEIEVEYDRYDKQYYFIYEDRLKKFEEFEPTLQDLGLIECLWNIFGGTITEKGYKLLDTHIGAIYGDSITLERARKIVSRLERKGFASLNVVFGIGSFTYQYNTRDTFGFACKATYAVVDGEERMLFKDPKTDDGTKKSQRGRVHVHHNHEGKITFVDGLTKVMAIKTPDLLEVVFRNSELVREQSLSEIRELLHN
ncbi:nicotinate phosphoribosyltransferase [Bacillus phage vB_BanS_Skywalker]|uniref:Nicotinamide phosphoribosyltransferase n=1 Tax=Bacillus phage vB_BanS_Skywalker TaxID=2894789 RepID=A0AAE8YVV2_9CAUD|nr:nicotinate phosphoribosyltransferase [Bacillus phage vB_BanS_Skywalker]UGO51265.1 nicotinate phosphoribosyltransferase [Bacillus phage vB_BanS_Skywalker]